MDLEELKSRTDRMQRQLDDHSERLTKVETTHTVNDVVMTGIETRLTKIEGLLGWIVKLIIGSIILALLSLVLINSGGSPP